MNETTDDVSRKWTEQNSIFHLYTLITRIGSSGTFIHLCMLYSSSQPSNPSKSFHYTGTMKTITTNSRSVCVCMFVRLFHFFFATFFSFPSPRPTQNLLSFFTNKFIALLKWVRMKIDQKLSKNKVTKK